MPFSYLLEDLLDVFEAVIYGFRWFGGHCVDRATREGRGGGCGLGCIAVHGGQCCTRHGRHAVVQMQEMLL